MSWDEFEELEYINWDSLPDEIGKLSDFLNNQTSKYLIIEPDYSSIEEFKNAWNKTQIRIIVKKITKILGDYYYDGEYYLGMGRRLLKQMKIAKDSKWKRIEIVRTGEKFETEYAVRELKLPKQTQINKKPNLW